jgi:hypothetical protein
VFLFWYTRSLFLLVMARLRDNRARKGEDVEKIDFHPLSRLSHRLMLIKFAHTIY